MPLELNDVQFHGPALPEPFVKFELERELTRLRLLRRTTGEEGRQLKEAWNAYRHKLRLLAASGGSLRVFNHVIEPLVPLLGYTQTEDAGSVTTREDQEDGGRLLISEDGQHKLRVWTTSFDEDLHAPSKRGRAYRFSYLRVAQRVLLATGERLGLLTNGVQLMLLISDPARPDSTVTISVDPTWKRSRDLADSFRFVLALASPAGVQALPELVDKARLQQTRVTKELRKQARRAVEQFLQEILDHPVNRQWYESQADYESLAKALWREGLITVYRLLFILKLESSDDPARSFSFASTSLWRNTFSPSTALASSDRGYVHKALQGSETGTFLESGLRNLFRMFEQGLECTELVVKPLGGALFGQNATPVLSRLTWGERAVAHLFDQLLWTTPARRGAGAVRERVHYGPLDVEDLGRVYEALLELEPGITTEPMCRLRRQKLEVVVPLAQGERYRPASATNGLASDEDEEDEEEPEDEEAEETPARRGSTRVEWVEEIPPHRFYLRVGLGRKASGSYYTPHSFVRFLVQETLTPQVAERCPADSPQPLEILKLKVLDPAMGSGHFLVEACRFLGEKLYEACRLCDERALAAQKRADSAKSADARQKAESEARGLLQRVIDLPDPDDELLKYLPSRSPEGGESGFSQSRAIALCRRMVATHCLYGVDKNPLAVELAKLALWLESHAEGMPLTFLDHRFVVGDSLTGPFWDNLIFRPGRPTEPVQDLLSHGLKGMFTNRLTDAIRYVRDLEAGVGATVAEIQQKERSKRELDRALRPFLIAAAAWSGGVMLGPEQCDDLAYSELLQCIASTGDVPNQISSSRLAVMISSGLGVEEVRKDREGIHCHLSSGHCVPALSYDLTFPEVFYPTGVPHGRQGFDAVVGNPPWDQMEVAEDEFWAHYDIEAVASRDHRTRQELIDSFLDNDDANRAWKQYQLSVEGAIAATRIHYAYQSASVNDSRTTGRPDVWRLFAERATQLIRTSGFLGLVLPSAFHGNEGATGIRQLYLQKNRLQCCYSFENRRQLFEIHRSFKFAAVVAQSGQLTEHFRCAFYLHDDEWLFSNHDDERRLDVTADDVNLLFGDHLVFIEARSTVSFSLIRTFKQNGDSTWSDFLSQNEMSFSNGIECHRRPDVAFAAPDGTQVSEWLASRAMENETIALREQTLLPDGKNIHQYSVETGIPVRDMAHILPLLNSAHWRSSLPYYRVGFRYVAASTNERTVLAACLAAGLGFTNGIVGETSPSVRSTARALATLTVLNSHCFDYQVRQQATTHVNRYVLAPIAVSRLVGREQLLAHAALRLTCNHVGYAALWHEQVGDAWREPNKPPFSWPVLPGDDERWAVRAAVDAVVADAYGLSREQYAHVLSSFSHTSYAQAPELCLASFDELKQIGLEAFTKKHDPYWDIPLNETPPQPVIDLPIPSDNTRSLLDFSEDGGSDEAPRTMRPRRRSRR